MTRKFGFKSTADDVLSGVDLKGKRFLVTGVSSGIGLETARSLVVSLISRAISRQKSCRAFSRPLEKLAPMPAFRRES